jgi:hypothetical protein
MNYFSFLDAYADQLGGQYTSYDSIKSVLVIPVSNSRFQTVLLSLEKSKSSGKELGIIASKVCEYATSMDLKNLLEQSAKFDYSKFIIDNNNIKVEVTFPTEGTSQDEIKHMIQEVANLADMFELKLTGKDIH